MLPILAEKREVIGVDLHGHGRTTLGDRPISLIDMGNDMAAILKRLAMGRSTCSATRWAVASRSAWRCSTRTPFAG